MIAGGPSAANTTLFQKVQKAISWFFIGEIPLGKKADGTPRNIKVIYFTLPLMVYGVYALFFKKKKR